MEWNCWHLHTDYTVHGRINVMTIEVRIEFSLAVTISPKCRVCGNAGRPLHMLNIKAHWSFELLVEDDCTLM